MKSSTISFVVISTLLINACSNNNDNDELALSNAELFGDYWYDGQAEISSYKLEQARYGEVREGDAIMIFVTEPYTKRYHTKADEENDENITVLKLNFTKNFVTGIYPYSIMTSIFYPVEESNHAIKLTSSTQECCGQTYMELVREGDFDININSYFQGESKDHHHEPISQLEDEIWTMIRVRPNQLPTGKLKMIPSFSYLRLSHKELKPYKCICSTQTSGDTTIYNISYSEIERDLSIQFESEFPHKILKWKENYPCGSCEAKENLESTGILMETLKIDYWNRNSKADSISRFQLGLH